MSTMHDLRTKLVADRWGLVPLRLIVGFGFVAHGYAKLARGPEHFAAILDAIGIPAPTVTAWVTALIELVGGAALVAGLFVVVSTIPLAVIMATAMAGVHVRYGFSSVRLQAFTPTGAAFGPIGYELNLLYIIALFTLAIGGPSRLSLDRWRERRKAT